MLMDWKALRFVLWFIRDELSWNVIKFLPVLYSCNQLAFNFYFTVLFILNSLIILRVWFYKRSIIYLLYYSSSLSIKWNDSPHYINFWEFLWYVKCFFLSNFVNLTRKKMTLSVMKRAPMMKKIGSKWNVRRWTEEETSERE